MSRVRLIHLSDVHIREPRPGWGARDFVTKRTTGWLHLLRRGRHFERAAHLLAKIISDAESMRPDAIIFSGDASALGFPTEVKAAARLMAVGSPDLPPGLAVPGNHDHYISAAVSAEAFEKEYAPWLTGRRIGSHCYPFARDIGGVWVIGVNSCKPNRLAWDASGAVGKLQLERLERLLGELPPGPRVLVTHYPYCQDDGQAEPYWHGLRDRKELAQIIAKGGVRLWLCGHRHLPFMLGPTQDAPFAIVCAGSATQAGRASYAELTIDGGNLAVRRHTYQRADDRFDPAAELVTFRGLFASAT